MAKKYVYSVEVPTTGAWRLLGGMERKGLHKSRGRANAQARILKGSSVQKIDAREFGHHSF